MKLITTNIFDFTSWYKFGFKFINRDDVIDTSDETFTGQKILEKVGFFEEEYDVFFLEIPNDNLNNGEGPYKIPLSDVLNIIPLTEKGSNILSTKLPDFKFSNPINPKIAKLLVEERNKELAINGACRLLASFDITKIDLLDKYQNEYLLSLLKYSEDLNSELSSMMDNILFYERSKPYPLTDLGFLFDVGGITMSRFNISEEDIRNREILKENDYAKYEIIDEIIALSKFLQSIKDDIVWSPFLSEYSFNDKLIKLSQDLSLVDNDSGINNVLIIAYYQKFRYLIRNTSNLEDSIIKKTIEKFYKNVPTETTIALYLVGMFFGTLKFKDIYYKNKPLEISLPVIKIDYSYHKQPLIKGKSKILISSKSNKSNDKLLIKNNPRKENASEIIENIENQNNTFNSKLNDTAFENNISKTIEEIVDWFNLNKEVSATNKKIWDKLSKSFLSGESLTLIDLTEVINKSGHKKILTQKVEKELNKFFKL
jgi:hypothetical protein